MDLDEDIPGLLLGNTTLKERQVIADWVQDALTHKAAWEQRRKIQDIAGSFRTDQQVMSTIPTLTEQNIRTFVGEQNFQKGRQLAHDRAILNPEQQAVALKAYCYGSLPEPYRVQVTFDGPRINSYLCSCPAGTSVDTNRGCEHDANIRRNIMTDRLKKEDFVRLLAARMNADEAMATAWVDGIVETLYESFKAGKGVTFPGFGGFYVHPEAESWVFKFNPGQRLRALFGWSSTYSGER